MEAFSRWMGTPVALARRLAFATVAGAFMGVIGPFGSYGAPLAVRLACWVLAFWTGALILSAALRGAETWRGPAGLPAWFAWPAAVAAAAAPMAAINAGLFTLLSPRRPDLGPLDWYLQTVVIAAPLSLGYLAVFIARERTATTTAPAPSSSAGAAPFLDRLPPQLGRELLALQMEDHYVRAHTLRGSALLLLPLGRAVEELGDLEGLRVHRSWWVARAAVEAVEADGRNLRLKLKGGLGAPVARNAVSALREAGWLDAHAAAE